MKRFLLALVWLLLASSVYAQPQPVLTPPSYASLPATCTVGSLVTKTTATAGLYVCSAANTWTIVTSGGSGAPTNATYITQTANSTLTAEQALGALSTGLMNSATTTGVVSTLAPTDDNAVVGNGTAWELKALPSCSAGTSALSYNTTTNAFGCNTISGGTFTGSISANQIAYATGTNVLGGFGSWDGTNLLIPTVLTITAVDAVDSAIGIGLQTAVPTGAVHSILIGAKTGNQAGASAADFNTVIGNGAARAVTTGSRNTLVGDNAGMFITTGSSNLYIGESISETGGPTTGDENVIIGPSFTGNGLGAGSRNVMIGSGAGEGNDLRTDSGNDNIFIGGLSHGGASNALTGSFNVGMGRLTLEVLEGGAASNTAVGYTACESITTGSNNTCVGAGADVSTATTSNTMVFGNASVTDAYFGSVTPATALHALSITSRYIANGTTPAVTDTSADSCGSGTQTIVGNDNAGKVTVIGSAGTSCTVTFATAFANAPSCSASNETTAALARATSTTTTVILAGSFSQNDVIAYTCLGR